jgi:hypothetical protein
MEEILHQVKKFEESYNWLGAADSYEKVLALLPREDFSGKGRTLGQLGYAFYRAALQAESTGEFKQRLQKAIHSYEIARDNYQRSNDVEKKARMSRCDATIVFMDYWLASNALEKKKLLSDCWVLTKKALEYFEASEAQFDYGKTYNMLSISPVLEFTYEADFQARLRIMQELVDCGEKAIRFLNASGDVTERARAYARMGGCFNILASNCQEGSEQEASIKKSHECWHKAYELSEETATIESLYPFFGDKPVGTDETILYYEKGLEYARKTRDNLFIGCSFDWLTCHTGWKGLAIEDRNAAIQLLNTAIQYCKESKDRYSKISFTSPRADYLWVEESGIESFLMLAVLETEVVKKRDLLEKALKTIPDLLKKAENSGYPEVMIYVLTNSCNVIFKRAQIETNLEEKRRLLKQALQYQERFGEMIEKQRPLCYMDRGGAKVALADIKNDLAALNEENETKKSLLQEAASTLEIGLKLYAKEPKLMVDGKSYISPLISQIGDAQTLYGNILFHLYDLTLDKNFLAKAVNVLIDAVKSFQKLNMKSHIAECHWTIARAYDDIDEHLDAAEYFRLASEDYKLAGEHIPPLKRFFEDYMRYMNAWCEIEKGRYHHKRQEYGLATEHFQSASSLHKSLKQWSYLTTNYSAWSQVEDAEETSRNEQSEEALESFGQAVSLFEESKKSIQNQLAKIEDEDEKKMATQMMNATDIRHEYCLARITIEEAKVLDKKGDHYASSEKYSLAAETFQKMSQAVGSEQDKKEFSIIATLSRAWAEVTRAEAEGIPDSYSEASTFFEKARELSTNEKEKMLTLGHSRFCKALEAGTRYADSGDKTQYTAAIQQLESATIYYAKAGFEGASDYAKATGLLLDAYMHMDSAKNESNAEKKAKLYTVAERTLQISANFYLKANHPEKQEHVMRLLENVRVERELAISIAEVLHAPSIISTTTSFAAPAPDREEAVGSERFEHADIQATFMVSQKEVRVGEPFNLKIDLVNAGKVPAQLIKVNEVVPKDFDLTEKPKFCQIEEGHIDMRGMPLGPLKTEELQLILKPKTHGTFIFKPWILYLDENGKYKTYKPDPVTLTVKELGISGWFRGQR